MGNKNKKGNRHREELKANRLIKYMCIALIVLALAMMVLYSAI